MAATTTRTSRRFLKGSVLSPHLQCDSCRILLVLQELDIQYTIGLATEVPIDYIMVGIETQDGDL